MDEEELTTEREEEVSEPVPSPDTEEVEDREAPERDIAQYVEPVDADAPPQETSKTSLTEQPVSDREDQITEPVEPLEQSTGEPVKELPEPETREAASMAQAEPVRETVTDVSVETESDTESDTASEIPVDTLQPEEHEAVIPSRTENVETDVSPVAEGDIEGATSQATAEQPEKPVADRDVSANQDMQMPDNTVDMDSVSQDTSNPQYVSARVQEVGEKVEKVEGMSKEIMEKLDDLDVEAITEAIESASEEVKDRPEKKDGDFSYATKNQADVTDDGVVEKPPVYAGDTPSSVDHEVTELPGRESDIISQIEPGSSEPVTVTTAKVSALPAAERREQSSVDGSRPAKDRLQILKDLDREVPTTGSGNAPSFTPESGEYGMNNGEPGNISASGSPPTAGSMHDPSDGALAVRTRKLTGTAELTIGGVPAGTLDLALEEQ